jgi:tRNA dimethylallyltransferase
MKLITILGPTSSGKSEMAVELANFYQSKNQTSWIISCDSRQVYQFLNLGTGKIEGKWEKINNIEYFIYKNHKHFLIDYINPFETENLNYNLGRFVQDFIDLFKKNLDLPDIVILVGGTGLYAKAVIENLDLEKITQPEKYQNYKNSLQKLIKSELQNLYLQNINNKKFQILNNYELLAKYLSPNFTKSAFLQKKLIQDLQTIFPDFQTFISKNQKQEQIKLLNYDDFQNPRRLQSCLLKHFSQKNNWAENYIYPNFEKKLTVAIEIETEILKNRITKRLNQRIENGILEESRNLLNLNLGARKFLDLGLEYRQNWLYLHGFLTTVEWEQNLLKINIQYARKQKIWLQKQKNINYIQNFQDLVELIETSGF